MPPRQLQMVQHYSYRLHNHNDYLQMDHMNHDREQTSQLYFFHN